MANQHAKCPRRGKRAGVRWGQKRRRCPPCDITWRIKPKKRGRKPLRRSYKTAITYLMNHGTITHFARSTALYRRIISRDALQEKLPWPQLPQAASFILIADAFLQYVERSWYTWYCILVRAVDGEDAIIFKPNYLRYTDIA